MGKRETLTTPYFLLRVAGNRKKQNRIGVVVGVSVHKRAVRRNFWRREAKSVLAAVPAPTSTLPAGKDFLVIISPKVNTLTRKNFRKILADTAAKAGRS